jgi:transcriptional regulator with XRE-family HTH domain
MKSQFSKHLRAARLNAGLTQAAMAERLGIGATTVCNVERGRFLLSERTIVAWARALDMSPAELLSVEPLDPRAR